MGQLGPIGLASFDPMERNKDQEDSNQSTVSPRVFPETGTSNQSVEWDSH
jgi:hypothetical protein